MLTGLNASNKKVIASESEKGFSYVCPVCLEKVILKKGRSVTHHFSHSANTNCSHGKGESQLHLKTKLDIFNYLKSKNVTNLELEKFLGENRPDIYFEWLSDPRFNGRNSPAVTPEVRELLVGFVKKNFPTRFKLDLV